MGIILAILGTILLIIGGIWLLVVQFKESVLWGLGCLFIPILSIVFLVLHWEESRKPFAIYLLGAVISVIGFLMSAPGTGHAHIKA